MNANERKSLIAEFAKNVTAAKDGHAVSKLQVELQEALKLNEREQSVVMGLIRLLRKRS